LRLRRPGAERGARQNRRTEGATKYRLGLGATVSASGSFELAGRRCCAPGTVVLRYRRCCTRCGAALTVVPRGVVKRLDATTATRRCNGVRLWRPTPLRSSRSTPGLRVQNSTQTAVRWLTVTRRARTPPALGRGRQGPTDLTHSCRRSSHVLPLDVRWRPLRRETVLQTLVQGRQLLRGCYRSPVGAMRLGRAVESLDLRRERASLRLRRRWPP
jgi:hypothetical protein